MVVVGEGIFTGVGFVSWVVLIWQHLYDSIQDVAGAVTLSQPEGRTHQRITPKQPKLNYSKRAHLNSIKGIPEHLAQEIKETAPLSSTGILPQKATPQRQGFKADQPNKQKQRKRVT